MSDMFSTLREEESITTVVTQSETERHKVSKQIARAMYKVPGVRAKVRVLVRFLIQSFGLSLKNKQRLHNFFAKDTTPTCNVICTARVPSGRSVKLDLDLHDDLSRMWYYLGYSGYERGTVRLFLKLLESKSCVFDVGANVGYYTLLAASALEGRGEVHAFEPCPSVFQSLARSAGLNGFRCLSLNQVGLCDQDGAEPLYLPSDSAGTNASLIANFTKQSKSVLIETMRLDSYCQRAGVGRIDLLKIDVEGAEAKVLRGAGALLDEWKPDIICEVLEPYEKELDDFFSERLYRKFLMTDDGLQETPKLRAHPQFRDYYLSSAPPAVHCCWVIPDDRCN